MGGDAAATITNPAVGLPGRGQLSRLLALAPLSVWGTGTPQSDGRSQLGASEPHFLPAGLTSICTLDVQKESTDHRAILPTQTLHLPG